MFLKYNRCKILPNNIEHIFLFLNNILPIKNKKSYNKGFCPGPLFLSCLPYATPVLKCASMISPTWRRSKLSKKNHLWQWGQRVSTVKLKSCAVCMTKSLVTGSFCSSDHIELPA
jgi:hypothetical protein